MRATGEAIGATHAQVADVTDPEQVRDFVARSAEALGGIDALVNNAGRAHPGNFATLNDEDWQHDFEVKVLSLIRCSREVLPHMRARGGGRIVNIGAVYSRMPDPTFFATSVNRAAGNNFTKALAWRSRRTACSSTASTSASSSRRSGTTSTARRAPDQPKEQFLDRLAAEEVPLGRHGPTRRGVGPRRLPAERPRELHHRRVDRRRGRHGPLRLAHERRDLPGAVDAADRRHGLRLAHQERAARERRRVGRQDPHPGRRHAVDVAAELAVAGDGRDACRRARSAVCVRRSGCRSRSALHRRGAARPWRCSRSRPSRRRRTDPRAGSRCPDRRSRGCRPRRTRGRALR